MFEISYTIVRGFPQGAIEIEGERDIKRYREIERGGDKKNEKNNLNLMKFKTEVLGKIKERRRMVEGVGIREN